MLNSTRYSKRLSNEELENFVRTFQNLVWGNRNAIWSDEYEITSSHIIRPSAIFKKVLGYNYDNSSDLEGTYIDDILVDIAGIIDQKNKVVRISSHQPIEVQNFTAAHELGHALLHNGAVLHRDIPVDGFREVKNRPMEEVQADRFASCFLMPAKHVKQRFKQVFLTHEFQLNSDTTFKLTGSSAKDLRKKCKNLHGLCMMLASAKTYDGEAIQSLAVTFNVSERAMAIRLEQLSLVKF